MSGFANQGASERVNKYIADIYTKKRAKLKIAKGVAMLEVKMQEIYSRAQARTSKREQHRRQLTVVDDLRGIYQVARVRAMEKRSLQLRLSAMETEDQEAEEREPLVTTEDALEVTGYGEAPLTIPVGCKAKVMAPSEEQLNPFNAASDGLLGVHILMRFETFGWCLGVLLQKNTKRSRKFNGSMVNFITKFDMDENPTDLSLSQIDYDPSPSAEYGNWLLVEEEAETPLA